MTADLLPCPSEWRTFDTMPDVGRKFIALYNDGSGAAMYFRHDGGFIDQDGNEYDAPKWANYDRWTYLPDLEFYCENCPEDPITLWVPPLSSEPGAGGGIEGASGADLLGEEPDGSFASERSCQTTGDAS